MNGYSSIPTYYKKIRFRSRLEAKWAYVFDHLKWNWDYEPIDLNGYIPDFILNFHRPILAEIKPVIEFQDFNNYTEKIDRSGWEHEAVIFGAKLFSSDNWMDTIDLGIMNSYGWEKCVFFRCRKCGRYTFLHELGSWACRVNGCHEGDSYLDFDRNYVNFLMEIWNKATNYFQYQSRAS